MKVAVEQVFNGSLSQVAIGGAYDATKINRGKHTGQWSLGSGETDKFIGPMPLGVANFGESSLGIPSQFLHPLKISDELYWIVGSDAATAAATRRVQLWTWVPSAGPAGYTFVGAITLTFPTATAHTIRGLRAILTNITTGTVAVSGTAVTGTGTGWQTTTPVCVGSRIGFGSTDPQAITTWYVVQAVGGDGSITLTGSAGTIAAGTPYVVQDFMILQATTNGTATNGGLFVVKGLRYEDFSNPATAIPAATTVDRIKAVYWLKDAATITNTVIGGCAIDDPVSLTQQYAYCTDGAAASLKLFRYNFRAPLTLTAGAHTLTGSDIVVTGAQAVTGNISQANNGRIATLAHGPGNGVPSLYLFTASRIVRVPLANIVGGSTTFIADTMSEVTPGSGNTNLAAVSGFGTLDIAGSLDKLVIGVTTGNNGTIYVTDYYTGGQQIDRRASCTASQLASANRDTDSPLFVHYPGTAGTPFLWVEDGWLFWVYTQAITANINAMTVYPLAADGDFLAETPNRIICPKISLGEVPAKLYRVVTNNVSNLGDWTMGVAPDAYRVQYRTSGIDDNTGAWIDVPQTGDLSGVLPAANIQFALLFRTAGVVMLPARILSLALIYEAADDIPSQYQWNFADFDNSVGTFAWRQKNLFGASLTTHTINIYRVDTDALVLTQDSTGSANGNFQFWNGSAWTNGLGSDAVGTRRRFVPTGSLPSGVGLYAKVTVA